MNNNQDSCRGLFSPEEEDEDDNPEQSDGIDYGIPSFPEMTGLFIQNSAAAAAAAHDMYYNVLSASFELPNSTVSVPKMETPCTKQILRGLELNRGESSVTTRKYGQFQETNRALQENGPNEDSKPSGECRKQKKTRSAEVHNLTERLRRQRLKEKMKCLQELIPNCSKRDKASTLDDAIKYITTLQYQLQMMSMGKSFSMLHSPWMVQSSGHHQGMQIPTLPQFLQTGPRTEIGIGDGIGMSGLTSSINLPITSNLALPSSTSTSSASAASRLPMLGGMSEVFFYSNS